MNVDELVRKYNLPTEVTVLIHRDDPSGSFYAKIKEYPGCMTYAENIFDLIPNITDAILTYFEVPRKDALSLNAHYYPRTQDVNEVHEFIKRPQQAKDLTELQAQFLYFIAPNQLHGSTSSIR